MSDDASKKIEKNKGQKPVASSHPVAKDSQDKEQANSHLSDVSYRKQDIRFRGSEYL